MTAPDQRTTEGLELRDRIDRYLRAAGPDSATARVVPLTGDASDRRYFRIIRPDGPSIGARPARRTDRLRHAAVRQRRRAAPPDAVAGPRAARDTPTRTASWRWRISATSRCRRTSAPRRRPSTRTCIVRRSSFIEVLQRRGARTRSGRLRPLPDRVRRRKAARGSSTSSSSTSSRATAGAALSDAQRAAIGEEWSAIAGELAGEPRVLCHRDYHSRNLMLHGGRLYIIDFQDARMGPDTYDLVSLLRDSYVDIIDREVDDLIAHFLALKGEPRTAAHDARVPAALRPDGAAAEPQGARHVRLPDDGAAQHRSTSSTCRGRCATRAPISRNTRASSGCASCWRSTSRSCGEGSTTEDAASYEHRRGARLRSRRTSGAMSADTARVVLLVSFVVTQPSRATLIVRCGQTTIRRVDASLPRSAAEPRTPARDRARTDSSRSSCSRRARTSTTTTRRPSPTCSSGSRTPASSCTAFTRRSAKASSAAAGARR